MTADPETHYARVLGAASRLDHLDQTRSLDPIHDYMRAYEAWAAAMRSQDGRAEEEAR